MPAHNRVSHAPALGELRLSRPHLRPTVSIQSGHAQKHHENPAGTSPSLPHDVQGDDKIPDFLEYSVPIRTKDEIMALTSSAWLHDGRGSTNRQPPPHAKQEQVHAA